MRDQAIRLKEHLNNSSPRDILSDFLCQGWQLKKQLASGISTTGIDEYYEQALQAGALGDKIVGAGGGGFLLLYCPKEKQPNVGEALNDLTLTKFSLEPEGSKIIYVI